MNELIDNIQELIDEYYETEFETYKFKSYEDKENIFSMVDELKEEVSDLIKNADFQIESEANDCIKHLPSRDILNLDDFRI